MSHPKVTTYTRTRQQKKMIQSNSTTLDLAKLVHKKLHGAKIKVLPPSEEILGKLFETMFYASLKTEESQFIKVTVTLIDPENPDPTPPARIVPDRWNCIYFKEKTPFTVKNLVKLSKAADPWSSSIAVYFDQDGELIIWGMIDQAIHYQSFLNYENRTGPEKPGIIQTTINGIGNLAVMFDYELIANLKQDKLISNYINVFKFGHISEMIKQYTKPYKKEIIKQLENKLEDEDPQEWEKIIGNTYIESLSRILLRIQTYQHGGAILITNKIGKDLNIKYKIKYDRLYDSIIHNSHYTILNYNYYQQFHDKYLEPSKKNMPTNLYLDMAISEFEKDDTNSEIKGAIRFISSLSCVDGLIVFTPELKVKGFGAVIDLQEFPKQVFTSNTSSINESKLISNDSNYFGTRHRSMFSYCWNNPSTLGFVISQDGDIRAVTRIDDKLIMWENIKVLNYLRSNKLARPIIIRKKR